MKKDVRLIVNVLLYHEGGWFDNNMAGQFEDKEREREREREGGKRKSWGKWTDSLMKDLKTQTHRKRDQQKGKKWAKIIRKKERK